MHMLLSGYSPGSREPATTPPRALAKIVCTHNGDPAGPTATTYTLVAEKASLRPLFDDLPRGSTIVTCPGNIQSPGPWPQRHAQPSQRHAGVQLRPRGGHLGPPSQPARQRRPCQSSWAGAQPAQPTVVGALLTPCDQGRHDGCPHRLGGRQEGRVTLKLGSPRVRVSTRRGCAVWRDHDDESAHHSTVCDTARFIEVMSGARFRCAYRNAEESPGRGARRWRAGSQSGLPPAPPSPPPGGRSSPAGPTAARGQPSGAG